MIETESAVNFSAPTAERPFDIVMKLWARWMRLKDRRHSEREAPDQDTKEYMALGEAVDAMTRDLPRVNRWALDKAHGMTTVWIFPDRSFPDALAEAERILTPKMRSHRDTQRYFND